MQSQFSNDLAHELLTPINNLMGGSEVALTRSRSSSDYRRVFALHRGRVQIDSQVGQGTTVRLHFPAHGTPPTTAAPPAASPAGEVGSHPR